MLVTVSSMTVPSPLELSGILSWNSQVYSEMPTVNQLNSPCRPDYQPWKPGCWLWTCSISSEKF